MTTEEVRLKKQEVEIQKKMLLLKALEIEMNRRYYRNRNKSFIDKVDDLLFGW